MARTPINAIILTLVPLSMLVGGYLYVKPEQRYIVVLATALVFVTVSYVQNKYKRRVPIYPLVVAVAVFAGMNYDFFINILEDPKPSVGVLLNLTAAIAVYFALVLHSNWRSREIFLGYQYSKEELKKLREDRIERIKRMELNESKLITHIGNFNSITRQSLEEEKYLKRPPPLGDILIPEKVRTKKGEELLNLAKDIFYALLYGNNDMNVDFERVEGELLTITIPRLKAYSLQPFMKAVTEIGGRGTWLDPEDAATDIQVDNVILEVEYRDTLSEIIGNGIKSTLNLINLLEVNEKILYLRMMNIEQSSL